MIKPVRWKNPVGLLSSDDLEKVHAASLGILERTGIIMPLSKGRAQLLSEHGVIIDDNSSLCRFPPAVVEEAVKKAPPGYSLCALNPEFDLTLDGVHGYLSTDGSATVIADLQTGKLRKSTKKDVGDIARIAEQLPQISFLWPSVSAQECNPRVQPLHELQALMLNSDKHIQAMTAVDPLNARGSIEIAALAVGGKDMLRERPVISNFQCSLSPLSYDGSNLEAALIFAEAGVPVGFVTMQIGSSTAPITLAGNLALGNAEVLAGITLVQLCFPGAPVFYGACSTMMELKRGGITSGGPEDYLLQAYSAQLARYYNIPSSIGTFCSSSKTNDWQAGMENSLSGLISAFSKADMMSGAGLINGAKVFSIEQMILDCEAFDLICSLGSGAEISDYTLALDIIDKVGPQGHFLAEEHTFNNLSQVWMPQISNRGSYEEWEKLGRPTPGQVAAEKAEEILKTGFKKPGSLDQEIDEIIGAFEKE